MTFAQDGGVVEGLPNQNMGSLKPDDESRRSFDREANPNRFRQLVRICAGSDDDDISVNYFFTHTYPGDATTACN
jgi:hypothetical protein